MAAAQQRGIAVTNVPGYSTAAVAQATIALLLECVNATAEHAAAVAAVLGDQLILFSDSTNARTCRPDLSLIGAGAIGSAVGRIAEAMGMQVIAAQVPGRPAAADRVPLQQALPQADVISLHCPQTEATAGLINAEHLALCRDDVIVLNSARGGLIDEAALATAGSTPSRLGRAGCAQHRTTTSR